MAKCNRFRNFKERGEWVEALFIAELLRRGYTVLKPWGDSQPFDVALNFGNRILRVQVKSTSYEEIETLNRWELFYRTPYSQMVGARARRARAIRGLTQGALPDAGVETRA